MKNRMEANVVPSRDRVLCRSQNTVKDRGNNLVVFSKESANWILHELRYKALDNITASVRGKRLSSLYDMIQTYDDIFPGG